MGACCLLDLWEEGTCAEWSGGKPSSPQSPISALCLGTLQKIPSLFLQTLESSAFFLSSGAAPLARHCPAVPTPLHWYYIVNNSLLRKKWVWGGGGVLAIPMLGRDWATELLQTALRVPQTGRNQQRLSCSESCCRKGFRRWEGPVWVCPYKVDIHRSLEAGGPPSLLPQAPGVREQKSITIWLPFGGPWLFSAQLRHIGGKGGPCLAWCFCK